MVSHTDKFSGLNLIWFEIRSPSSPIFILLWFIIIIYIWCFSILVNYTFLVSFNFKIILYVAKLTQSNAIELL